MKIQSGKKIILSTSLLFATIVLIAVVIIFPTIKQIQQMNRDTESLLSYLETRYENAKNLRASIKKAQEIKEEVVGFEKHLFRKGGELKLITTLESIAAQNDLEHKIENSNLDNITGQYADLSLLLTGDYHKALQYLYDLENNEYFININNIYLTPIFERTQNKVSNNVNLRVNISLYVNK